MVVTFLAGSYVSPVNSKDILGKVIAVALFKSGDCSNLAKNFWVGPYANGTLIVESSCLTVIPLNKVPKEIIVLLRISL